MGKVRKHLGQRRAKTLDDVADNLPDRFLDLSIDMVGGRMDGLRRYQADLQAHAITELGRHVDQYETTTLMSKIGVDLASCMALALGHQPSTKPFYTTADRECGGCHKVKPGASFAGPVYPGQPQRNLCRDCVSVTT